MLSQKDIFKILYYIAVCWVIISAFSAVYTVFATLKNFFKTVLIWIGAPFESVSSAIKK